MTFVNHQSSIDPHYLINEFGSLILKRSSDDLQHGDDDLAILFTADDLPILLKHGPAKAVATYRQNVCAEEDPVTIVLPLEVLRSDKGPAILEEINACLAISGRVALLEQRLQALQG